MHINQLTPEVLQHLAESLEDPEWPRRAARDDVPRLRERALTMLLTGVTAPGQTVEYPPSYLVEGYIGTIFTRNRLSNTTPGSR